MATKPQSSPAPDVQDPDVRAGAPADCSAAYHRWLAARAKRMDPGNEDSFGSDFDAEVEAARMFAMTAARFKDHVHAKLEALAVYVRETAFDGNTIDPVEPYFVVGIQADLFRLGIGSRNSADDEDDDPRPSVRPRPLNADDLAKIEKARALLDEAGRLVDCLTGAEA